LNEKEKGMKVKKTKTAKNPVREAQVWNLTGSY
jgi:hypothetical protein